MPEGLALEFSGVTKRFGAITAVSDFSARVESGLVTGFLGPNGAGKTTSLRILLGLVRATAGTATIGGKPYAELTRPLQTVGAVLEASSFHPGRTAANHLAVYAQAAGIPRSRVDDVLGLVGLADAAGRKVGGFSLGMRQRLGLAYALLGDPGILVLDEPANGLDPEGIKWMRGFLRQLAREGRTVLTSSHLLAEVQQTVDSLLVIAHGRLVFEGGLDQLTDPSEYATVIDSPDRAALTTALTDAGVSFEVLRSGITVRGLEPAEVGAVAAAAGVALSSLQRRGPALEEVFLDLVNGTRVHASAGGVIAEPGSEPPAGERVPADADAPDTAAPAVVAGAAGVAAVAAGPDERTDAATGDPAGAVAGGNTAATVGDLGADDAVRSEFAADGPSPAASAAFVVASTGVIDVVSRDAEPEPGAFVPIETDEKPATDASGGADSTGIADDSGATSPDDERPEAAAPLEVADPERPWEDYVKTDSDLEADAFFSSFDAAQAAALLEAESAAGSAEPDAEPAAETSTQADPEPSTESDPETPAEWETDTTPDGEEPEPAADEESWAVPEPASDGSRDTDPEAASERDGESDPDREPDSVPDPDAEPEPAADAEHEPTQQPEPEPEPEAEASIDQNDGDPDDAEPSEDTSEFGALSDLSPEWVEEDHHRGHDNGDEQR